MKNIYLIIGPSGVGKTTLAKKLAADHGLKNVNSYTTRKPRYDGEVGHIFVSDEEFDQLGEMIGLAEYNGHRYGVTEEIINTSDLYVIEPLGAQHLVEKYHGPKNIYMIKLMASRSELETRMKQRGDTKEKIKSRLTEDASAFDYSRYNLDFDFSIHADGIEETAQAVWEFISFMERYSYTVRVRQIHIRDEEGYRNFAFAGSSWLKKVCDVVDGKVAINMDLYDLVYEHVWRDDFETRTLDQIYMIFNRDDRPNPKGMHSLSVSDILEIESDDPNSDMYDLNGKWFCDSFGWRKIEDGKIDVEE